MIQNMSKPRRASIEATRARESAVVTGVTGMPGWVSVASGIGTFLEKAQKITRTNVSTRIALRGTPSVTVCQKEMTLALEILFGIAATVFSVMTLQALISLRHVRRLPTLDGAEALPKVSIIFAARDEAERVETTIRRLLAQKGVEFEIIPVDDRSRDETGQIFKKLSGEDA